MATNKDFKVKNGLFVQEGILKGYATALVVGQASAANQFVDAGPGANIGQVRYTDTATASPNLLIGRARGTTLGSFTTVQSGDRLATILITGADGTAFTQAASLLFEVDGTVATGQVPGRLMFSTASSTGVMSERMRIDSSGNVLIGTTTATMRLNVLSGLRVQAQAGVGYRSDFYSNSTATYFNSYNDTLVTFHPVQFSASNYNFSAGAAGTIPAMSIDTSGNVGVGGAPSFKFDVQNTANSATVIRAYNGITGSSGSTVVVCQTDGATTNLFANSSGNVAGGVAALSGIQVTTNTPFGIWTNNAERIRITAAGEVLIGASSQTGTAKLYVAGARSFVSGEFLGGLHVTDSTTGGAAGVGGTIAFGADSQGAGIKQYGAIAGTKENSTVTDLAGYLAFYSRPAGGSLTERLRITSTGIVQPGGDNTQTLGAPTTRWSTVHAIGISDGATAAGALIGSTSTTVQHGAGTGWTNQVFYTGGTERMRIDSGGNVGIGTNNPTSKLHVAATNAIISAVGTTGWSGFAGSTSSGSATLAVDDAVTFGGAAGDAVLAFASAKSLFFRGGTTERMRLDSSGNLGIGTSSPGYKLDVSSTSQNNPVVRIIKANSGTANEHGGALIIANQGPANIARAAGTYGGRIEFQYSQPTSQAMQVGASIYSAADGTQAGTGTAAFLGFCTSDATAGGANNERMRINSAGNVLIGGTTNVQGIITAKGTIACIDSSESYLGQFAASAGVTSISGYSASGQALAFLTTTAGSGASERMRIDTNGNLLMGKTSSGGGSIGVELAGSIGQVVATRSGGDAGYFNRLASDGNIITFNRQGVLVGAISVTTSATAYNTTSDVRLKKNIVDAPSAAEKIKAMQVRSFDWKADGSHVKYGFIAQELNTVEPLAVTPAKTEEDVWAIDPSKLVATLTKALQEALARIEALEAKLA
jgi:hypothetical protein